MGNGKSRQRLKFQDFEYISKNTNFANSTVSLDVAKYLVLCM